MVDVVNPKCKYENCSIRSGKDGFCMTHSETRKKVCVEETKVAEVVKIVKKKTSLC